MSWVVLFDDAFAAEFRRFDEPVRKAILTYAKVLESLGPQLGRPYADTLNGSRHRNMKELRPTVDTIEWRVAFTFDPRRRAILLTAAAKGGRKDRLVYKRLIDLADARFDAYLDDAQDPRS
ncbi:type II toxin-antitoxin system RelE/ParE family toxin [Methylobacterium sp. NEAU 140]|uniref:type II toxin-antitoxin system RelE/ParE family toxin n=1 Tax=Methylobacterium sp. NEAU 140 TaxID=3064945 RepID=UPI002734AC33|nr:type II toxin-antitoxin system RelE/ParE family toxin [Methylobacterium sp. NEAU 140]MDP4023276.1 type II toxin-antitoxin system RelE/ParE family toxin [Methylobacterium sp. NEAU 140]